MARKIDDTRSVSHSPSSLTRVFGVNKGFWKDFRENHLTDEQRRKLEGHIQQTNKLMDVFGPHEKQNQAIKSPTGQPYYQALSRQGGDSAPVRKAKDDLLAKWNDTVAAKAPRVVFTREVKEANGTTANVTVDVDALDKWRRDFNALNHDMKRCQALANGVEDSCGFRITATNDVPDAQNMQQQYKSSQYILNAENKLFYYNAWENTVTPLNNSRALSDTQKKIILEEGLKGQNAVDKISGMVEKKITQATGHEHYRRRDPQKTDDVNIAFQDALRENPHQIVAHLKYLTNQQIQAVKDQQEKEKAALETLLKDKDFEKDIRTAFSLNEKDDANFNQVLADFRTGLNRRHENQLTAITKTSNQLLDDARAPLDKEGARISVLRDLDRTEKEATPNWVSRVKRFMGAADAPGVAEELKKNAQKEVLKDRPSVRSKLEMERIKHQVDFDQIVSGLNQYGVKDYEIKVVKDRMVLNDDKPIVFVHSPKFWKFGGNIKKAEEKLFYKVTQSLIGTRQDSVTFTTTVQPYKEQRQNSLQASCASVATDFIVAALKANIPLDKIKINLNDQNWGSNGVLQKEFPRTWEYLRWLEKHQRQKEELSERNTEGEDQDFDRARKQQEDEKKQQTQYIVPAPDDSKNEIIIPEPPNGNLSDTTDSSHDADEGVTLQQVNPEMNENGLGQEIHSDVDENAVVSLRQERPSDQIRPPYSSAQDNDPTNIRSVSPSVTRDSSPTETRTPLRQKVVDPNNVPNNTTTNTRRTAAEHGPLHSMNGTTQEKRMERDRGTTRGDEKRSNAISPSPRSSQRLKDAIHKGRGTTATAGAGQGPTTRNLKTAEADMSDRLRERNTPKGEENAGPPSLTKS